LPIFGRVFKDQGEASGILLLNPSHWPGGGTVLSGCLRPSIASSVSPVWLQFLEDYEPTRVDSYCKRLMFEGQQVMLDITDTTGQEDYAAVRDHYLRTADGYLCVFSLAEPESLQDIIDLRHVSVI